MASPRRIEQINILIREMIADILVRDEEPLPGALVTVTRVAASDDLHYAYVYISVLGADVDETAILKTLEGRAPHIQHQLNRRLRMRPVPRIKFAIDEEEKRRERIEKLLAEERAGLEGGN